MEWLVVPLIVVLAIFLARLNKCQRCGFYRNPEVDMGCNCKDEDDELCPNCGYYCNGLSVFCTKHPDGPARALSEPGRCPYKSYYGNPCTLGEGHGRELCLDAYGNDFDPAQTRQRP